MNEPVKPRFSRILVKLSGEALLGSVEYGVDPAIIKRIAGELQDIVHMGVQTAVVIGAATFSAAPAWPAQVWIASLPTTWACSRPS